jgi:hypothetical protein
MLSRSVPACLMRAHVIEEQGSPAVAAPRDHARCLRTLWRWEAPGAGIYRPACGPAASRAATRSAPDAEGGSALLGHSQRPEVRYEFGQHDPPVHHLAQQPRLPLYDLLVSGGARRGPGWRLFFASIAWRPRTSRAVQFNFTGRQVALQVGRRPDPLDPRHAGQVVQGRPRCPLNIAVHRRHYSTAGSGRRSGVGPRPKSGRSSRHSTANSRPGFASPLPTRWRPASGPGSDDGLTTRRASTVEKLPAACRSCDRQARRGQAQGPDGPAGAEGPGRAVGIAVDPLAAAASAQHQAYKIARPRGTAPLAAGS